MSSSLSSQSDSISAEDLTSTDQELLSESTGFWSSLVDQTDYLSLNTSLYTKHYDPKPEHNNTQNLIDLQWHWKNRYLAGFSFFKNSFDQPTKFAYAGRTWGIPQTSDLVYVSLLGGFLHGYDGEHKEDIPLNDHGIAPAILPTIGVRYSQVHSELIFFGTAGFTVTLGYDFPMN